MKNIGMITKLISLGLILISLGIYQTVATARAKQLATVQAEQSAQQEQAEKLAKSVASQQFQTADEKYIDGEYEGTGFGFGGDIVVKVTVQNGKIHAIDVLDHSGEDDEYFKLAVGMIDTMIADNNPDVDAVTGSTFSSEGLLEAVHNALDKAVKQ